MARQPHVVVVGAGVGGLATAYWLRAAGISVEVLEAGAEVGGRIQELSYRGDVVDVGAQFYHSDYHSLFRIADDVGLTGSFRRSSGVVRYVLKDGSTFRHNPSSLYLPPLGLRGHADLYAFYIRHVLFGRKFPAYHIAKDIPEYDQAAALDLCSRRENDTFRDFVVYPLSYASNLGTPEFLNLYHLLHQFKLGTFAKFAVSTRGMRSLARAMADTISVRLEAPVERILTSLGRVTGVTLRSGEVVRADHVVVATAPPSAAAILPDDRVYEREFMNSIIYGPVALPVLFLDRRLSDHVLVHHLDPRLRPNFLLAIDHAVKVPELVPSGKSILTVWAGHPKTLDLYKMSDAEVIGAAVNEMAPLFPALKQWIEHAAVVRHSYGLERYPPGSYGRILEFVRRTEHQAGISYVGALFGGSGMEASALSGQRACAKIQREFAAR